MALHKGCSVAAILGLAGCAWRVDMWQLVSHSRVWGPLLAGRASEGEQQGQAQLGQSSSQLSVSPRRCPAGTYSTCPHTPAIGMSLLQNVVLTAKLRCRCSRLRSPAHAGVVMVAPGDRSTRWHFSGLTTGTAGTTAIHVCRMSACESSGQLCLPPPPLIPWVDFLCRMR